VIEKLGANGGHPNIVSAFGHGKLEDDRYYFDMEICILNLDDYISGDFKIRYGIAKYLDPKSPDIDELGCLSFVGIITQFTNGLEFIHSKGQLHRDLKPRNSIDLNALKFNLS
jgi:serine/threonine protein kinase